MFTRQDYIVQEFKRNTPAIEDRKALYKQFTQFVKGYGYKITSRQAERILNMYNGFVDLSKFTKRSRRFYEEVLQ